MAIKTLLQIINISAVYAVTDGEAKFTMADGKTRESKVKAGECRWNKAEIHAAENIAKTDVHVLNIEFKK